MTPTALRAQLDGRAAGVSYLLAFPDTTTNAFDTRFPNGMGDRLYIAIYSAVDNSVSIHGNGYDRTVTPTAGRFTIVDLTDTTQPAPLPIVTRSGEVSDNTFRLEAQSPIVVYCYMVTTFGCEAWTPIPVEFWGTKYYAASLPGEIGEDVTSAGSIGYTATPKSFPSEITIVASEENTLVTVTAGAQLLDTTWSTTVRLNANQAYQLQTYVDTGKGNGPQPDFAGAFIVASKPIGVLSGNTRGMVEDHGLGIAKNIYKDMMIEWIAPLDQQGREFVYMPTIDGNQLTGAPNEDPAKKRYDERVRIYASKQQSATGFFLDAMTGGRYSFTISRQPLSGPGGFYDHRAGVPAAMQFRTDQPAQAFMNTTAVVQFMGTTGGGGIGAKYDGYGTFMVELTPREQWISFAPFYAPPHPSGMNHFINVVADTVSAKKIFIGVNPGATQQLFPFRTKIKGTDLIWGTMPLNAGVDYYLTGWNSATGTPDTTVRFGGFVYGLLKGHEEYRPGGARKKDQSGGGIASAAKPAEVMYYEEYLGAAYGYPLAPSRLVINPGDSMQIDTSMDCAGLTMRLTALNESPVGLRTIKLDSNLNAKLEFIDPANPQDITGKGKAVLRVAPIDPLQDASAILVIIDRANRSWRVWFRYEAERMDVVPKDGADFGQVTLGRPSAIGTIRVTNPMSRPDTIRKMVLVDGTSFTILSPTVPPLIPLRPGQSIDIQVQITPTVPNRIYRDSLKIDLCCIEIKVPLQAQTPIAGSVVGGEESSSGYSLSQNDPNPLRHMTTIDFTLGHAGPTTLEVYNAAGERVATLISGEMDAGAHSVRWDASGVAAGMYYYRLKSGGWTETRTMIVR
jgi:hypothetical protein